MVQVGYIVALDIELYTFALPDQRDQLIASCRQCAGSKPHLTQRASHYVLKIYRVKVFQAINEVSCELSSHFCVVLAHQGHA